MTFGFIGLGQMGKKLRRPSYSAKTEINALRKIKPKLTIIGYPMARNLRMKLPETDKVIVLDINRDVMGRFVTETQGAGSRQVDLAQSAREVAEKAVSKNILNLMVDDV